MTPLSAGAGVAVEEGAGAGVGAGVCDSAAPPMQSISEAAPQPASIGFANMDIIPILKAAAEFVVTNSKSAPAVDIGRIDFDSPDESALEREAITRA